MRGLRWPGSRDRDLLGEVAETGINSDARGLVGVGVWGSTILVARPAFVYGASMVDYIRVVWGLGVRSIGLWGG